MDPHSPPSADCPTRSPRRHSPAPLPSHRCIVAAARRHIAQHTPPTTSHACILASLLQSPHSHGLPALPCQGGHAAHRANCLTPLTLRSRLKTATARRHHAAWLPPPPPASAPSYIPLPTTPLLRHGVVASPSSSVPSLPRTPTTSTLIPPSNNCYWPLQSPAIMAWWRAPRP